MAGIFTSVDTDIQKLRQLKLEIEAVKKQLKSIDVKVNIDIKEGLEAELKSMTDQYHQLAEKVSQTESKIERSVQNITRATEKIVSVQNKLSEQMQVPASGVTNAEQKDLMQVAKVIEDQIKGYSELERQINGVIGSRTSNIKRMITEQNAISAINREIATINKSVGRYGELSEGQKKRVEELTHALLHHKIALAEVRQNLNNHAKLNIAADTSINALSQSLSRMRMTYRELTEQERNSPFGKELLSSIQQADAKIKELDASIGNHQRNVGNYSGQWNGLSMSIQQIAREMPSLAYGPRVFFSAISNNLPILSDEIKRAKDEYKALIAQGQKGTPIWRQVISSLFSWQTAMTVGITLLTLYGDKLVGWIGEWIKGKKAISDTYSSLKEFHDEVGKAAGKALFAFEKMSKIWQTLDTDDKKREALVKYRKEIDETTLSINSIREGEDAFAKNKGVVVKAIMDRAWAMAGIGAAAKEFEKIQSKMAKLNAEEKAGKPSFMDHLTAAGSASGRGPMATSKDIFISRVKRTRKELEDEAANVMVLYSDMSELYDGAMNKLNENGIKFAKDGSEIVANSISDFEDQIRKKREEQRRSTNKADHDKIENEIKLIQGKIDAIRGKSDYKSFNAVESQSGKLLQIIGKNSLARMRLERDMEFKIWQSRIDAMREGQDKVLELAKFNRAKEMENLSREKEDLLQKKTSMARDEHEANEAIRKVQLGKSYKRRNFDESYISLSTEEEEFFDEVKANLLKKHSNELIDPLIKEYQSYADQRLEIERKFNDDIERLRAERRNAESSGNTDAVQLLDRSIAKATADKGKSLMEHDFNMLKQSPEYSRAFDDLRNTSSSTIKALISEMERYKSQVSSSLNPADLKAYTDAIRQMYDELGDRDPFEALKISIEELTLANSNLDNAQWTLSAVQSGAKIIKGMELDIGTGKSNVTYLSEAEALKILNKAQDDYIKSSNNVNKARKNAEDYINTLSSAVKNLGKSMGGMAGDVLSLIGDVSSFAMQAISAVNFTAKGTSAAIRAVESASVILAVISAALQIATQIFSLISSSDGVAEYEKAKDAYESYINILDKVINRHLKLAEALTGSNAKAAYEEAKRLIELQSESARILGKQYLDSGASRGVLGIGSKASKGTEEFKDMSREGWEQAAKTLGVSISDLKDKVGTRMKGLFELTNEELVKLSENATIFVSQLDSDTQKYFNQIVEGVAKVEDILEQKKVNLTLIDLDNLRSDFLDLLTDMDADSAKFAENFEEYMKKAMLNALIKEKYAETLKAWRNELHSSMESGMTPEKYKELEEKGKKIADDMNAERDALASKYGWGASSSQDSTKRGFETMTQDQAGELNGRFTALQVLGEEKKGLHIITNELLREISTKVGVGALSGIGDKSREIIADGYKANINIVFPDAKIDALTSEVVSLRGVVTDMQRMSSEALLEAKETSENVAVLAKQGRELVDSNNSIKQNTSRL